jgi:hypothetical protein
MGTIHTLSLYYNEYHVCKIRTAHLSIQASAADYAWIYFTIPKRQLVTRTVVGLTTPKFKTLIIIFLAFTPKSYVHFSSLPCITTQYFINYYARPPKFNRHFNLHQYTPHLLVTSSIWVIFVNQALSKPTSPAIPYLLTILWSMLSTEWRTKWSSIWFSIKYSNM